MTKHINNEICPYCVKRVVQTDKTKEHPFPSCILKYGDFDNLTTYNAHKKCNNNIKANADEHLRNLLVLLHADIFPGAKELIEKPNIQRDFQKIYKNAKKLPNQWMAIKAKDTPLTRYISRAELILPYLVKGFTFIEFNHILSLNRKVLGYFTAEKTPDADTLYFSAPTVSFMQNTPNIEDHAKFIGIIRSVSNKIERKYGHIEVIGAQAQDDKDFVMWAFKIYDIIACATTALPTLP